MTGPYARRLFAGVFTIGACVALSACPSKTVQEGGKSIAKATDAQCRQERETLRSAVEAYTLLKGAAPVSEAALVPDWIRSESAYYDLDAQGNVIPSPTAGCTV